MKPASLLSLLLCAVFLPNSFSDATNVLQNSDFEVSGEGIAGWRATDGTTRYTIVHDPVRRSNCIEGIEPEPGGTLGRLVQNLDDKAVVGGHYRLTGWIKTTDVTSEGGVVIGVGTVNAVGAQLPGSFQMQVGAVRGTTDWTLFDSGDFVLPDLTTGSVNHAVFLNFNGAGGGTARFDDVSLVGPLPPSGASVHAAAQDDTAPFQTTVDESVTPTNVLVIAAYFTIFAAVFSALWAFRKYKRYARG